MQARSILTFGWPSSSKSKSPASPSSIKNNEHGDNFNNNHNDVQQRKSSHSLTLQQRRISATMDLFHHHHHKDPKENRRSLTPNGRPSSSTSKSSPKLHPTNSATLKIGIESPPLVFYGPPTTSTGALLSGQITLKVHMSNTTFTSFDMQLLAIVTTKKPVVKDCPSCATTTSSLFTWTFFSTPTPLSPGYHTYPFSYLLPGHLPTTTQMPLGTISYHLSATATNPVDTPTLTHPLNLSRALLPPTPTRTSTRIFPPTTLTATLTHPSVLHPIGTFPLHLRLTGLTAPTPPTPPPSHTRHWHLKKLTYRLQNHSNIISPACPTHAPRLGGSGKGIQHTQTTALTTTDLKSPSFQTDLQAPSGGCTETTFSLSLPAPSPAPPICCDVETPTGLSVKHVLVIEMVVGEEVAPVKKPGQKTPTGVARVLRMQVEVKVTERGGLGVSWDEEMPPTYADVEGRPPGYRSEEGVGEVVDGSGEMSE